MHRWVCASGGLPAAARDFRFPVRKVAAPARRRCRGPRVDPISDSPMVGPLAVLSRGEPVCTDRGSGRPPRPAGPCEGSSGWGFRRRPSRPAAGRRSSRTGCSGRPWAGRAAHARGDPEIARPHRQQMEHASAVHHSLFGRAHLTSCRPWGSIWRVALSWPTLGGVRDPTATADYDRTVMAKCSRLLRCGTGQERSRVRKFCRARSSRCRRTNG